MLSPEMVHSYACMTRQEGIWLEEDSLGVAALFLQVVGWLNNGWTASEDARYVTRLSRSVLRSHLQRLS